MIKYLKHKEINKQRWDDAIASSSNSLIYAKSTWLDAVCSGWDAIISDDYNYLMPVPHRKKLGVKYVFQPFGLPQGGIFYIDSISPELQLEFLTLLRKKYRFGHLDMNEGNEVTAVKGIKVSARINLVLPLNDSYQNISADYNDDGKKNLRRAAQYDQTYSTNGSIDGVFDLYKTQYGELNKVSGKDYAKLKQGIELMFKDDAALIRSVLDENEKTLGSAIFLRDNHRLYYILGAPSEKGRKYKSMHLLIDKVIEEFSNSALTLDFEGSEIKSVANFYMKFGSVERSYPLLKFF